MLGDSTASTGNYIHMDFTQSPLTPYAYSPSTVRAIDEEEMRQRFEQEYRKAMDEVAEKQKVENGKKYKSVAGKAKKMRTNMVMPGYDPSHEPDEFTLLSNHDFHKLLEIFDSLLEN